MIFIFKFFCKINNFNLEALQNTDKLTFYKYEYRKYKIIIITAKWLNSRDASSPDWATQLNVSGKQLYLYKIIIFKFFELIISNNFIITKKINT